MEYAYDYESITHSAGQRIQTETQIPFFWYIVRLYAEEEGAAPHEHDGQFPQLVLTTSSLGENGGRFAHILSNLTSLAPKLETSHPSGNIYSIHILCVFTHFTHLLCKIYQQSKHTYPYSQSDARFLIFWFIAHKINLVMIYSILG